MATTLVDANQTDRTHFSAVRGKSAPAVVQVECSDSDESSSSSSSSDVDAPSTAAVLGVGTFGSASPRTTLGGKQGAIYVGGGKGVPIVGRTDPPKKKKCKAQQAAHFRRLRTATPMKRSAPVSDDDGGRLKKKRRGGVSEPDAVRLADAKIMDPHPAVIFMREHTPVKPCGRFHSSLFAPCTIFFFF